MTTETMREAVKRAIYAKLEVSAFLPYEEIAEAEPASRISEEDVSHEFLDSIAADVIRTVLERLDDPTDAMVEAGNRTAGREAQWHCDVADIFRAMLAAITPPLPESADSGRG